MVTELVAALLPLLFYPELFKRTAVTFFLDNQSALMSLVKGGSRAVDLTGHHDVLASTLGVPLVHVVFAQFMLDIMRMSPVEVVDMIEQRLCSNAPSVEGFNGR